MSHNIGTNPFGSGSDPSPFLTVAHPLRPEKDVSFLFYQGPITDGSLSVCIPADESGGFRTLTWIGGEDLFAFRELLNELPESAFVRPADPVLESTCLKDADGDWWEVEEVDADGETWLRPVNINGTHYARDYAFSKAALLSRFVETDDFADDDKPFWSVGDSYRYGHGGGRTEITYTKTSHGWIRTIVRNGEVSSTLGAADDRYHEGIVKQSVGYEVIFRKNA